MDSLMYIVPTEPAGEYKFLDPKEVISCELMGDILFVKLEGHESLVINQRYKLFDELTTKPDFANVSETMLLNIRKIISYDKEKGILKLKDGITLKVEPEIENAFLKSIS
jgi:DNA-binding LytR/AlgR family response regulator